MGHGEHRTLLMPIWTFWTALRFEFNKLSQKEFFKIMMSIAILFEPLKVGGGIFPVTKQSSRSKGNLQ
ncbi:MAG: hypothetical protein CM15mP53_09740 [Ectothiorhodospiraceae bacterium]|nr:MAG: hypothetical protein CM15mP53_09740 [Ectothiorhodospiraceae bacterium]